MKYFLSLIVFLITATFTLNAQQDSLILMNGKSYSGEITKIYKADDGDSAVALTYVNNRGKSITEEFTYQRMFSYSKSGQEKVCYYQNEFAGDYLTVPEARNTVLGSNDARQHFKPRFVFWSSLALGLGSTIMDTYVTKKEAAATDSTNLTPLSPGFFNKSPSWFPFLVPAVLTVSWSIPSFKVKHQWVSDSRYIGDANYYRGFHRICKQRRMLAALKGSLIGIGTGFLTYYIIR